MMRTLITLSTLAVLATATPLPAQPADRKTNNDAETFPQTRAAWTYKQARNQLALNPGDAFLQYVALQLGGKQGAGDAAGIITELRRTGFRRRQQADLFRIFSGALAVQESLQLDTMVGRLNTPRQQDLIDVNTLQGPTVKSHPWKEMLDGRKNVPVSRLSLCVPDDQYFVRFQSLNRMLDILDLNDQWGAHLIVQTGRAARNQQVSQRLKRQLAVVTDALTRPFYDLVVNEVAVTGSDLYLREGSDVTLLFGVRQPQLFRVRMDGFLTRFEKSTPGAVRSQGEHRGVKYTHLTSPDRVLHVYSAYPKPDLHVRSNSLPGLLRVLDSIHGTSNDGSPIVRLGETDEFRYIRTLMPLGAEQEQGLVYLSDPFIRYLTGPVLKLTERRRMLTYNHLRMIGHASLLYRTQFGSQAASLQQLADTDCSPGVFGQGRWACPSGGDYRLSADGTHGTSSIFGHPLHMTPCCEVAVTHISEYEAKEYQEFVQRYEQYWRTFFDPIAIRIQATPQQYRFETIVLPLINNSIYSGLSQALGGETEPLDALPLPKRNIFTLAGKFNKSRLLPFFPNIDKAINQSLSREFGITLAAGQVTVSDFLTKGLGNQLALHVYDTTPTFDFNFTQFLGQSLGSFNRRGGFDDDLLAISLMVASLNSPVYLSLPVQDAEVVDRFLDSLDAPLAIAGRRPPQGGFLAFDQDFYRVPLGDTGRMARGVSFRIGPLKWRFFYARIGQGLYIASKREILDDLLRADTQEQQPENSPSGHAMLRIRADHWNQILKHFQLGWSESSREAGLNNLSMLSNVARAESVSNPDWETMNEAQRMAGVRRAAEAVYGCRFFCPDGGHYHTLHDGQVVACGIHGTAISPRQLVRPSQAGPLGQALQDFRGATATLSFLEDGLRAVVTIDRNHK
ncbi:MAG: hypothetical protein ABGZ17_12770 [Planctomycetaceae bacterium]